MKKTVLYFLVLCFLFTACSTSPESAPTTQTPTETTPPVQTVIPLPQTLDLNTLDSCTIAVSLQKSDAYVDDTGAMQMKVTVYTYDLYDMVDISRLTVGDIILLRGQEVPITGLEPTEYGSILINGGLDVGGYELRTDDNTVYYETGYSDIKSWYSLGEATIPVSQDFIYTDSSDLDQEPVTYYPGDFLIDSAGIDYHFTPYNTTITISGGKIIAMHRTYAP